MIKNSVLGIVLVCGVFSISMVGLWALAVEDWESKMEQPKGITAINTDTSTTINAEYLLLKHGFLTDFQISDFISDCHQLKGKLVFDRIYHDRGTYYDLRCKA